MLITKIRIGLSSRSIFRDPVTFILSRRLFYDQDFNRRVGSGDRRIGSRLS